MLDTSSFSWTGFFQCKDWPLGGHPINVIPGLLPHLDLIIHPGSLMEGSTISKRYTDQGIEAAISFC